MMTPTSDALVQAVRRALVSRIAGQAGDDPWSASELRSIDAVLSLVAARLTHEPDVLAADTSELRTLLASLASAGLSPATIADDGDPRAVNHDLRQALTSLLPRLHDGTHPAEVAEVRRYLVAAADREAVLYSDMTSRRPV